MKRIFVHVPKTGGQSIQRSAALRGTLVRFGAEQMPTDYVTHLRDHFDGLDLNHQLEHCRWRDLLPEFTSQHQAVAIVRNPWSKIVSQFLFAKKIDREHSPKNPVQIRQHTTFDEFLELRHRWGFEPFFWHRTTVGWYPQVDHVTDTDGNLRCDILRFEDYDRDTMQYFSLTTPLEKRNVSSTGQDYRDFYTAVTQKIIARWFKRDIDFFGFTFDGGATRNTWAT